jgi:hypothetical protein
MRIELMDCVVKMLDTPDSDEHLRIEIPRILVHKNYDPNFEAIVRMVDTRKGPMLLPYERFVFEISQMDIYYIHEKRH